MSDGKRQELDEADVSALKEMAQWWRESGMTRRAALGLAGGATLGAATGGGFLTGRASAQASTSDDDGDIGAPDNRVDIFADGIDANSLAQTSATFDSISTGAADITKLNQINYEDGADLVTERSAETQYQNNHDESMLVTVVYSTSGASGSAHRIQLRVSADSSGLGNNIVDADTASADDWEVVGLSGVVPPGYYYDMPTFGDADSSNIQNWYERRMMP